MKTECHLFCYVALCSYIVIYRGAHPCFRYQCEETPRFSLNHLDRQVADNYRLTELIHTQSRASASLFADCAQSLYANDNGRHAHVLDDVRGCLQEHLGGQKTIPLCDALHQSTLPTVYVCTNERRKKNIEKQKITT